jgi:hypothetical protein
MKNIFIITLAVIIAGLSSCRSVQKLHDSSKIKTDSAVLKKKDSSQVKAFDSLVLEKFRGSVVSDHKDSIVTGVVITLDPDKPDTTHMIVIDLTDDSGLTEKDYADAEGIKPKRKIKVTIPSNTTKVEIFDRRSSTKKDSSGLTTSSATTVHAKDSTGVSSTDSGHVKKDVSIVHNSVKKHGLTCGGGFLLIIVAGLVIFIYYRYRKWKKIRDALKPPGG